MEIDSSHFTTHNVASDYKLPECLDYFTLTAPPNTRICRKASSRDEATAPMVLMRLSNPLVIAEVTITADFEMEWDQAGLVIFSGSPPSRTPPSPQLRRRRSLWQHEEELSEEVKWVKAGLEFTESAINASSVVATSIYGTDWSLSPLCFPTETQDSFQPRSFSLRIKFERVGDALWIWYRNPDNPSLLLPPSPEAAYSEWRKLREVGGFFHGVNMKGDVWVGCYASRPVNFVTDDQWDDRFGMPGDGEGRGLNVEFEDLEIL